MPLARIDLPAGKPASYRRAVADVVYEAMVETLKAPKNDRFQVITEHAATVRITHGTLVPASPAAIPTVYTAAATTDASPSSTLARSGRPASRTTAATS